MFSRCILEGKQRPASGIGSFIFLSEDGVGPQKHQPSLKIVRIFAKPVIQTLNHRRNHVVAFRFAHLCRSGDLGIAWPPRPAGARDRLKPEISRRPRNLFLDKGRIGIEGRNPVK